MIIVELLVLALLGLLGGLGWRLLAPNLRRLQPEDTSASGGWLWLTGFLVQIGVGELLLLRSSAAEGAGAPSLARFMLLQALAGVLAVGVVLVLIRWRERSVRGLGLRVQRGPPALFVAVAGWLMFSPCFVVVGLLNDQVLDLFGVDKGLQRALQLFMEQPEARHSVLVWISMTVLIPIAEEVLFRGALFGGLRRLLHPGLAIALSATMFGLAHESVTWLPAAALGAFLAWLYERTGSLSAPIIFHGLHNGLTLWFATLYPDIVQ